MMLSKKELSEAIDLFLNEFADKKGVVETINIYGITTDGRKTKDEVKIVYEFEDRESIVQEFTYDKFINLVTKQWRRSMNFKEETLVDKVKDYFRLGFYKNTLLQILDWFVILTCIITFILIVGLLLHRADVKCRIANPYSYEDYRFCMGI